MQLHNNIQESSRELQNESSVTRSKILYLLLLCVFLKFSLLFASGIRLPNISFAHYTRSELNIIWFLIETTCLDFSDVCV